MFLLIDMVLSKDSLQRPEQIFYYIFFYTYDTPCFLSTDLKSVERSCPAELTDC